MRSGHDRLDGFRPWAFVAGALLVALASAGPAAAVGLPTSGLAPCSCTANIDKVVICAHKASFKLSGHCDCATSFDFTANAVWRKSDTQPGGSAAESLHLTNGQEVDLSAQSCPADPWLYNVTCTQISITPQSFLSTWQISLPLPGPFTAGALSDAQKQAYQPQEQNQCPLPIHSAPQVISPTPNQVFADGTHHVLVSFKETDTDPAFAWASDTPSYWKFMVEASRTFLTPSSAAMKSKVIVHTGGAPIVTPVSAGGVHPGQATAQTPLIPPVLCSNGQFGSQTVTLDPGKYHLRARVWSPKQHDGAWSQWVDFEVK